MKSSTVIRPENRTMRRHGEGAWVEKAARISSGLPAGPGRREALVALCNEEGRNERLISRMLSAREYALKWIDEAEIKASLTTVEMIRTLEGVNPAKAASIRLDVLQGRVPRPQLHLMLKDTRNESEGRSNVKLSLTVDEVVQICRKNLIFMKDFEWIEPPADDKAAVLGADMEFSFHSAMENENGIVKRTYEPRWALVISPYVSCSRIAGAGLKGFVLSTMALSWFYPKVSAFCTSHSEEKALKGIIESSKNSALIDRVIFHLPSGM